jgi:hypothetical protein
MQGVPVYPVPRSWIGAIIAGLVLVLDVVFMALGQLELKEGLLIGGLALAVLL